MGWNSVLETRALVMEFHFFFSIFCRAAKHSWCSCSKWDIGLEIKGDVKRDQVGKLFREVMEGERGK
ncbi:hypothetical protein Peur_071464 [Populus x canadensis]